LVRVVALRCGALRDVSREATWSCNCWVGRCGRGCCFEVSDYGGLGWEYDGVCAVRKRCDEDRCGVVVSGWGEPVG
jgi:hypothetical protein